MTDELDFDLENLDLSEVELRTITVDQLSYVTARDLRSGKTYRPTNLKLQAPFQKKDVLGQLFKDRKTQDA